MQKLLSGFLIFLGCAFAQTTTHPPNGCPDRLTYSYTTAGNFSEEYSNTQYSLANPEHPQVIPAAGIHVIMRIDPIATTGWHGHNGGNRPAPGIVEVFPQEPGSPLSGNTGYGVTGPDGKVTFYWRGSKYSGWYVVNVLPQSQDPCNLGCKLTNPDLGNYCFNIYMTETDHSTNTHQGRFFDVSSSPQVLNDYGSNDPYPDSRHTGHSRYITFATLAKLGTMSLEFRMVTGGAVIDILRAGLPSGGYADNQVFPIPFGAYLLNEWMTQYSEPHPSGNEVDFINPGQNNPDRWGKFVAAVNHSTCVFGRLDPTGNPLGDPVTYWGSQPIVHVVCDPSIDPPPISIP